METSKRMPRYRYKISFCFHENDHELIRRLKVYKNKTNGIELDGDRDLNVPLKFFPIIPRKNEVVDLRIVWEKLYGIKYYDDNDDIFDDFLRRVKDICIFSDGIGIHLEDTSD